jgi:hypothetical protein
MGGGYGGSIHDHLVENGVEVKRYKGAESTNKRSLQGNYKFVNVRSAAHWLLREALDPSQEGGSPVALPPNPRMVADLTAPTYTVTANGIRVEPKEIVVKRLGRSTNYGDCVIMNWFFGPTLTLVQRSPEHWRPDQRAAAAMGQRGMRVNLGPRRG